MTEVFRRTRVTQAWLAGIRHLAKQRGHHATNIILEVSSPQVAVAEDREVVNAINALLKKKNAKRSVMTAAATIFPQSLYQYYGRPEWYGKYKSAIARGKSPGGWGTYALRMIDRKDADGSSFNPLEKIIEKLAAILEQNQSHIIANYELGISDPSIDIDYPLNGEGFELPTYNAAQDRHMRMGNPCLSHVTFKLMNDKLDLTAIYRSHYYAERALGNLIGLAQLQQYVAAESGFEVGVLTCISTYAKFDNGWGAIKPAIGFLATLPPDEPL